MAICKFFQLGTCKKGSNCDFEHIFDNNNSNNNSSRSADKFKEPPRRRQSTRSSNSSVIKSVLPGETHIGKKPIEGGGKNRQRRKVGGKDDEKKEQNLSSKGQQSGRNRNRKKIDINKRESKNSHNNNNNNSNNNSNNNNNNDNSNSNSDNNSNKNKNRKSFNNQNNNNFNKQNIHNNNNPSLKDYVDMVMNDLATRPSLWYFSSYGLSLSPTASLPFPLLGTTELSVEELRLQVYAEAAATGGRIDNYVHVVSEMKRRAEEVTKMLIPNLESAIESTLKSNGIPYREAAAAAAPGISIDQPLQLQSRQEALKQALLQSRLSHSHSQSNLNLPAGINISSQDSLNLPYNTTNNNNNKNNQFNNLQVDSIIPDDAFTFGCIPEMAPE